MKVSKKLQSWSAIITRCLFRRVSGILQKSRFPDDALTFGTKAVQRVFFAPDIMPKSLTAIMALTEVETSMCRI